MKKSEMIDKIVHELRYFDNEDIEKFSEKLLDSLIDFGMVRPSVQSSYKLCGFNVYNDNNYWEKEDG